MDVLALTCAMMMHGDVDVDEEIRDGIDRECFYQSARVCLSDGIVFFCVIICQGACGWGGPICDDVCRSSLSGCRFDRTVCD